MALDLRLEMPAAGLSSATLGKLSTHTRASVTKQYKLVLQRKLGSKQAHRATHWPRVHDLAASAGVWLRASESQISAAAPWAKWLGKGFYYTLLYCICTKGAVSDFVERGSIMPDSLCSVPSCMFSHCRHWLEPVRIRWISHFSEFTCVLVSRASLVWIKRRHFCHSPAAASGFFFFSS